MIKHQLIIATRESPLALKQARWVKMQLSALYPYLTIKLLGMTTEADRMLTISLAKVGGKGLFVKELEQALLDEKADIAVHSVKDMPMDLPPGLCMPVICTREDPRDVLLANSFHTIDDLPKNAAVGTSSLRRQCQLLNRRPDINVIPLRGNVNTRLDRLAKNEFAGLVLAAAGLKRLGIQNPRPVHLSIEQMVPAVGQGALGIECRSNDNGTRALIQALNHLDSQICITAERALCKRLGGGCQLPVAAYAEMQNNNILLRGLVGSVDGKQLISVQEMDAAMNAEALGIRVAEALLNKGADSILRSL